MHTSLKLITRDIQLSTRVGGASLLAILFFTVLVIITPFAIGTNSALLTKIAPAILWTGALLASLLSLERLFLNDMEDGCWPQLCLSGTSHGLIIFSKLLAHWLVTGLPLVIIAPLLGFFVQFPGEKIPALLLSLSLGTPVLTLIGGVGAAVTATMGRGGMLLSILVIPLSIPVIIFAIGILNHNGNIWSLSNTPLLYLAAIACLFLILSPLSCALALADSES